MLLGHGKEGHSDTGCEADEPRRERARGGTQDRLPGAGWVCGAHALVGAGLLHGVKGRSRKQTGRLHKSANVINGCELYAERWLNANVMYILAQ